MLSRVSRRALAARADPDLTRSSAARHEWAAPNAADGGPSRLAPFCALVAAGLLLVAVAFAGARSGSTWADPLFWSALAVIVGPVAGRLVGRQARTGERLGLVVVLGLGLYAVKILHSPSGFTLHDEFGFYRSTSDLLSSGSLYTSNPVVGAYSYYPGLQAVTAAVSSLTGLSIFPAGLIVVGVGRVILMLGLFGFVQRITGSARVAGIGGLLYTANPNFLYFDAQFAYESLGVALAAAALLATAEAAATPSRRGFWVSLALICVAATTVTHHLTSYALAVALVVWALAGIRRSDVSPTSAAIALASVALVGAWASFAGTATTNDVGPSLTGTAHALVDLVTGSASSKRPFTAAPGYSDPVLEQVVGLLSVVMLLIMLAFALRAAWSRRGDHPGIPLLGLAALAYPATLALRLSTAGTETSNRASEFVFVGIGACVGLLIVGRSGSARRGGRTRRLLPGVAFAALAILLFSGGLIVGWAPYARLPGRYEVAAGSRSVDPEGIGAARWAARWLPRRSVALTDATNKSLMAAYGGLDPQGGDVDGTPVGELLLSPLFGPAERRIVEVDKVRYLIVDTRLSGALPRTGEYFDSGDPSRNHYRTPAPLAALTKFGALPDFQPVFHSDHITIYSVAPTHLHAAAVKPGASS